MTNSILMAMAIFITIAIFRKIKPTVWDSIPQCVRWLVPVLLGVAEEAAVALQSGQDWREACLRGVLIGLTGGGTHAAIKNLPGPYSG